MATTIPNPIKPRRHSILTSLVLGLGLTGVVLLTLSSWQQGITTAYAAGQIRYVSPTGSDAGNNCFNSATPCATIQHAVDAANPGDEIRIAAGTYSGVNARQGLVQVVYVDKNLTLRGGYAPPNWGASDPKANPTTLDAQRQGRVMVINGPAAVTVTGLRITGGQSPQNAEVPEEGVGGGIAVFSATVTLENNAIFDNLALRSGAGVILAGSQGILRNNTVYNNTGGSTYLIFSWVMSQEGEGIFILDSDNTWLDGNLIEGNICRGDYQWTRCLGSGVHILRSNNVTLTHNIISRNQALGQDAGSFGAGVALQESEALLTHNTIVSNTTTKKTPNVTAGGGVSLYHKAQATLKDNLIAYNEAGHGGGVNLLWDNVGRLEGNHILKNKAGAGGGLFISSDNQTYLNNNVIGENQAGSGGAIWFMGGDRYNLGKSVSYLTNTAIVDNQGSSALYFANDAVAHLWHTTIARNHGSAIHLSRSGELVFSSVRLTNTILVSHTIGVTAFVRTTAVLNGVLWSGNGTNTGGAGAITVTNAFTGDPAFLALAPGNYHLSPTSAALDRGIETGVLTDIDGQPRPFGDGPDLGADEGQPALLVSKQASAALIPPGASLTYTLRVTNTGFMPLTPTITDVLPDGVTPTGPLTWKPALPIPNGVWTEQVVVTVDEDYAGPLVNVLQATSAEGASAVDTETTLVAYSFYLPLIWRSE